MEWDKSVSVSLQDLIELSNRAKELSLKTSHARSVNSGSHVSKHLGRGMEFSETRRYQPGDDIRTIDWRVTARTGKVHSKVFSVEKERQVYICVDMRRPMFFATQGVFKSVQAATIAGYLAWSSIYEGSRTGGLIFDDVDTVVQRPSRGKKGTLPFLKVLAEKGAFSPNKMKETEIGCMEKALSQLPKIVPPGSSIYIISDFRNPTNRMNDILYSVAMHSDVTLCMVYDPIEETIPLGYSLPVTSGKGELRIETIHNDKGIENYRNAFNQRKAWVESFNRHRRIDTLVVTTQMDCFEVLRR